MVTSVLFHSLMLLSQLQFGLSSCHVRVLLCIVVFSYMLGGNNDLIANSYDYVSLVFHF